MIASKAEISTSRARPFVWIFTVRGCSACRGLVRALPAWARRFVTCIDRDREPRAARCLRVSAVPVVVVFARGRQVARMRGYGGKRDLAAFLEKHLRDAI